MSDGHASRWTARGTVYLLHFSEPYYHAQHYAGFATKLERRLSSHRRGKGSCLMAAVVAAEIPFILVRTWDDVTRHFERRLHRTKHLKEMCPICTTRWLRPMYPRKSEDGLAC